MLRYTNVCVLSHCSVMTNSATSWSLSGSSVHGILPKNTGVGCHVLLHGIFLTQGSNPGLLCCRQILYHLSYWEDPFVSLGKFIPRYFILCIAMVNGIESLISLSDFSLLIYRNASDYCILFLYPATLLNSLISSRIF